MHVCVGLARPGTSPNNREFLLCQIYKNLVLKIDSSYKTVKKLDFKILLMYKLHQIEY